MRSEAHSLIASRGNAGSPEKPSPALGFFVQDTARGLDLPHGPTADFARRAGRAFYCEPMQTYREHRRALRAEAYASTRAWLLELMRESDGNISEAARRAQISRSYLHGLLDRHDVEHGRPTERE